MATTTKTGYTVRKSGDNFALYFNGSVVESGLFATRATANKHKRIAEQERTERLRRTCDQCQLLRINGVVCHEIGCPNAGKRWENGEWVKYAECFECGFDVRLGDVCDCQSE